MNLILNSQSLTRKNHAAPGDLLRCYEALKAWYLGISHQELMASLFSRMKSLSATPLCQAGQHSSSAFLFSQTLSSSEAEQGIPLWFRMNVQSMSHFPLCSTALSTNLAWYLSKQGKPFTARSWVSFSIIHTFCKQMKIFFTVFSIWNFSQNHFLYAVPVKRFCCMCWKFGVPALAMAYPAHCIFQAWLEQYDCELYYPWQGPSQNLFPANNWQCELEIHYFVGTLMPANWFSGVLLVFKLSSNEKHIKHLDWFIGNEPRTGAATSAQAYLLTEY